MKSFKENRYTEIIHNLPLPSQESLVRPKAHRNPMLLHIRFNAQKHQNPAQEVAFFHLFQGTKLLWRGFRLARIG
ncbi:hypothetical protein A0U92_02530 [Acetobacter aceti]|uniref:Uncharacterized protein n=1 Tax=Acetobacter aceti TaxID=435 RepID=A0A1U9KDE4_ACEAC|nr:hypothetical protein A0U92_02530 [Acetobacter aceti]